MADVNEWRLAVFHLVQARYKLKAKDKKQESEKAPTSLVDYGDSDSDSSSDCEEGRATHTGVTEALSLAYHIISGERAFADCSQNEVALSSSLLLYRTAVKRCEKGEVIERVIDMIQRDCPHLVDVLQLAVHKQGLVEFRSLQLCMSLLHSPRLDMPAKFALVSRALLQLGPSQSDAVVSCVQRAKREVEKEEGTGNCLLRPATSSVVCLITAVVCATMTTVTSCMSAATHSNEVEESCDGGVSGERRGGVNEEEREGPNREECMLTAERAMSVLHLLVHAQHEDTKEEGICALMSDRDDILINALLQLSKAIVFFRQRGTNIGEGWSVPRLFVSLLDVFAFDPPSVVDLIQGGETNILEYLLFFLRYSAANVESVRSDLSSLFDMKAGGRGGVDALTTVAEQKEEGRGRRRRRSTIADILTKAEASSGEIAGSVGSQCSEVDEEMVTAWDIFRDFLSSFQEEVEFCEAEGALGFSLSPLLRAISRLDDRLEMWEKL